MDCLHSQKGGAEILLDYCAGALGAERAAEIEKHLRDCPACMRAVKAQREVWETLGQWHAPEVSGDFDARLYARIGGETSAPAWSRWLRRLTRPVVPYAIWKPAALAVACAVLVAGFLVHAPHQTSYTSVPASQAAAQTDGDHVDIEQVANALEELDLLAPSPSGAPASSM